MVDILMFGRWAMVVCGLIAVLAAIVQKLSHPDLSTAVNWIFGVLLIGLGTFGLEFMTKYRDWISQLKDLVNAPSEKTYTSFLAKVGQQKLPIDIQKIGLNYILDHPLGNLDVLLRQAKQGVPAEAQGAKALDWALQSYRRKEFVAGQILASNPSEEVLGKLDPATMAQIKVQIERLGPDGLQRKDLNPKIARILSDREFPVI